MSFSISNVMRQPRVVALNWSPSSSSSRKHPLPSCTTFDADVSVSCPSYCTEYSTTCASQSNMR